MGSVGESRLVYQIVLCALNKTAVPSRQERRQAERDAKPSSSAGRAAAAAANPGGDWTTQAEDATVLYRGEGAEQNDAMAVAMWEKGATGGDARSQHSLGICYMHGSRGLPMNAWRARSFLKAATAQGFNAAIEDLKLLNACELCGAPNANRTCGACRSVKGISIVRERAPECQKKDWTFHMLDCGGLKVCECRNCRVSERGESNTSAAQACITGGWG